MVEGKYVVMKVSKTRVRAEMANNILRLKSSKNLEVTIGQLKEEEINSETII